MPIEIRPAEEAFAGLSKVSRYPSPDRDGGRYLPFPDVQHTPKFKISRSDKILTIGSCFARNIERALKQLDLNVLSSYVPGMVGDDNISNKYTSRSILNDLRLALSGQTPTDEDLCRTIYVNDKGLARNLAFGGAGSVKGDAFEEVLASSRKFYENLGKIREAEVVIVTFGLIETWYDQKNDVYLNIPPSMGEIKKEPGRFVLHVLSYEDIRADMIDIFKLISEKGKPGVQILSTVSPVPLHNTFRAQDCLQANMYSKSVQRAALEEVLGKFDNVHYFPSYEMVALAAPRVAWVKDDYRHVLPATVDRIMRKVIAAYIGEDALPPLKADLKALQDRNAHSELLAKVDAYLSINGKSIDESPLHVQYYYGASCLALGRKEQGLDLIRRILAANPNHPNAKKLIERYDFVAPPEKEDLKALLASKSHSEILAKVESYLLASGKKAADCASFIQYYYGASCLALGRKDEGLRLIRLVLAENPKHPNANKLLQQHAAA